VYVYKPQSSDIKTPEAAPDTVDEDVPADLGAPGDLLAEDDDPIEIAMHVALEGSKEAVAQASEDDDEEQILWDPRAPQSPLKVLSPPAHAQSLGPQPNPQMLVSPHAQQLAPAPDHKLLVSPHAQPITSASIASLPAGQTPANTNSARLPAGPAYPLSFASPAQPSAPLAQATTAKDLLASFMSGARPLSTMPLGAGSLPSGLVGSPAPPTMMHSPLMPRTALAPPPPSRSYGPIPSAPAHGPLLATGFGPGDAGGPSIWSAAGDEPGLYGALQRTRSGSPPLRGPDTTWQSPPNNIGSPTRGYPAPLGFGAASAGGNESGLYGALQRTRSGSPLRGLDTTWLPPPPGSLGSPTRAYPPPPGFVATSPTAGVIGGHRQRGSMSQGDLLRELPPPGAHAQQQHRAPGMRAFASQPPLLHDPGYGRLGAISEARLLPFTGPAAAGMPGPPPFVQAAFTPSFDEGVSPAQPALRDTWGAGASAPDIWGPAGEPLEAAPPAGLYARADDTFHSRYAPPPFSATHMPLSVGQQWSVR
jgi:hypothetical protein